MRAPLLELALLASLSWPAAARAQDATAPTTATRTGVLAAMETEVEGIVERVRPSVVQVAIHRSLRTESGQVEHDTLATSGIIWSAEGHVVSLGRAFDGADAVEVSLSSGETRAAEIVGLDEETGLALLKIDTSGLKAPLTPAPLGGSQRLRPGAIVVSVTCPFGLSGSAAIGIVSGRDRVVRRGRAALTDILQVTTPVNPGDPGGALADSQGLVVAIVASTYERPLFDRETLGRMVQGLEKFGESLFGRTPAGKGDASSQSAGAQAPVSEPSSPFSGQGIGFAIPIDTARPIIERLRSEGKVERGWLGVQVVALDPALRAQFQLTADGGVLIVGVRDGSPAEKGGLLQYDVVMRYGGREVADLHEFRRMVLDTAPGRSMSVEVLRRGARTTIEVTAAARQGTSGAARTAPEAPTAPGQPK